MAEVCREHQISETLFYSWRDQLLEGGAERLSGKEERTELAELRKRVRDLERTLGRKTYELEIAGKRIAGVGVSERVAYARELHRRGAQPPRCWRAS